MKFLYDFFPILLFFIAYKWQGIIVATAVAIVASIVQVSFYWLKHRRFERMHVVSTAMIVVLGGLTILLRDKSFIMWKPTLVNWLFGLVFLGTQFFGSKTLIERMLSSKITLPKPIWGRLNLMWVGFFLVAGAVNIYFAQDYQKAELALTSAIPTLEAQDLEDFDCSKTIFAAEPKLCETAKDKEEFWVNFKLFGLLGLTFLFVIGQGIYLARHIKEDDLETQNINGETK